jgi:hypothetical protein
VASNLVDGDTNGRGDVFLHDRDLDGDGVFDEAGNIHTRRVSVSSSGNQGDNVSLYPAVSGDAEYVAFSSSASTLVPGDTNGVSDVFVHNRQTGATTRVSVSSSGSQGTDASYSPAIDLGGYNVAFWSYASDLVPGDTNGYYDVFVRDRDTDRDGIVDEPGAVATSRLSVSSSGGQGDGGSGGYHPAISGNGDYVAFGSNASTLVAGDENEAMDIFLHNRDVDRDNIFDEPGAIETTRVSVNSLGDEGDGNSRVPPAMSGGAEHIAFGSDASNLVLGDTNGVPDVFIHDRGATDSDGDTIPDDQDTDDDNDGLGDEVDVDPLAVSTAFSDEALGGTTFGALNRNGLTVEVREEPSPAGVRITAEGSGGPATVDVCGLGTLDLTSGDDMVVTCGSATIEVLAGPVEATLGPLQATLPSSTTTTIAELAPGAFEVTNSSESAAPITVNGIQIPPGHTESDNDGDGFFTSVEQYVGTDPLDGCPDGPGDDAWPLDIDRDGAVSGTGDAFNYVGRIGATPVSPNWWQRLDLDMDSAISVTDDVFLYVGRIGETCP